VLSPAAARRLVDASADRQQALVVCLDCVTPVDIVPTVLARLGVPAEPAWALDGTVLAGLGARLAPASRITN
jgi:hypothetical protein